MVETLVYGRVLALKPEDHHHPHRLTKNKGLHTDVDPFGAAAWPMKVAPLDQKVTINHMWQAWWRLMGGQISKEEVASL